MLDIKRACVRRHQLIYTTAFHNCLHFEPSSSLNLFYPADSNFRDFHIKILSSTNMIPKWTHLTFLGPLFSLVDCMPAPQPSDGPAPGPGPKRSLVALGDSFTAAVGAGTREQNDNYCRRFDHSYFNQLLNQPTLNFDPARSSNVACAGAVTGGIAGQVQGSSDAVNAADVLVMTVGGNDVGFPWILNNCIYGWAPFGTCTGTMSSSENKISNVGPALDTAIKAAVGDATSRATGQKLYVLGYPTFFNDGEQPCNPASYYYRGSSAPVITPRWTLTPAIRTRIDNAITALNTKLAASAQGNGATFVDPNIGGYYDNHRLCEGNTLNSPAYFFNNWNDVEVTNGKRDGNNSGAQQPFSAADVQTVQNRVNQLPNNTAPGAPPDADFLFNTTTPQKAPASDGSDKALSDAAGALANAAVSDAFVRVFHPNTAGHTALMQAVKDVLVT